MGGGAPFLKIGVFWKSTLLIRKLEETTASPTHYGKVEKHFPGRQDKNKENIRRLM